MMCDLPREEKGKGRRRTWIMLWYTCWLVKPKVKREIGREMIGNEFLMER